MEGYSGNQQGSMHTPGSLWGHCLSRSSVHGFQPEIPTQVSSLTALFDCTLLT